MPLLIPALLSFLASLPGALGTYFSTKADIAKAQLDTQLQIELAKTKLATAIATSDVERSKDTLASTGSYFKYFTFFMWFGPFMAGVLLPHVAIDIFANLKLMPEWYVQSCMLIMFAVWGISVSAPVISSIFSGLGEFFQQRSGIKLRKDLFYKTLRSTSGPIGQHEVDLYEKALKAMGADDNGNP